MSRHVRFSSPLISRPVYRSISPLGEVSTLVRPTPYRISVARTPRARVHHLLAFTQRPLLINYNFSFPPSSITSLVRGLPTSLFGEPATSPPQPRLTLIHACMPWRITIVASNARYVNVNDVFMGLYTTLRTNVTLTEFSSLERAGHREKVCKSYRKRYRRLRGQDYVREKMQGIKRIDFMMGHTKFLGLTQRSSFQPDVWQVEAA
ncbi:hypothetical protein R3P38DRAFT_2565912 [Favolaschia claudopus]|uniref:DUF6699 domain-containing protein n=1 Tax=Favolaschia claudopus TaxID=2862362 RepID=A0AAV9ZYH0_9AGAR